MGPDLEASGAPTAAETRETEGVSAADGAPPTPELTDPLQPSAGVDVQSDPEAIAEPEPEPDLEALSAQAQKADEYLQLAQRTKADFENFRKRAARDAALAQERGAGRLAKELLPAIDNLERAVSAAQTAAQAAGEGDELHATLVSGLKLVHADLLAALERSGIARFSPEGEPFDPQHHEAVAQQPVEGTESGTVVEVYQRGYRLGETILRPARVLVAQ